VNVLDPKYLVKKRRFLRKYHELWDKADWNPYTVRYMSGEFDRLMLGYRDHRVGDAAISVWMAAGFPL